MGDEKTKTVRVLRKPAAWKLWTLGSRFQTIAQFLVCMGLVLVFVRRPGEEVDGVVLSRLCIGLVAYIALDHGLHALRNARFHDFQQSAAGVEELRGGRRWWVGAGWLAGILGLASGYVVYFYVVGLWVDDPTMTLWLHRGALVPVAWLLLRDHVGYGRGLLDWSSTRRVVRELERVQAAVVGAEGHQLGRAAVAVTLDHRDLLARIAANDLVVAHQLAVLGLRPETRSIVPGPWWVEVPAGTGAVDDAVETEPEIVASNDALLSSLTLLVEMGLVRLDGGRLRVTLEGREAIAMPAALAISTLPAHIRAELARADLKFFARDYEGCATICGTTLESFSKASIRQLHPARRRRNRFLGQVGIEDLDKATLGGLARALAAYLDVNEEEDSEAVASRRQWLAAAEFDASSIAAFGKDRRQGFVRLLSMCVALRNEWLHHNPAFRGSLTRQVEDTYRLLHLTRITISSFCAESGIDPFFAPSATHREDPREEAPGGDAREGSG
jgi:hypothetical protein